MRSKSLSLFLLPWHEKIYIMPCKISSCKKSNTWPNKEACICRKLIKFFSSNNKTFWSSTFEENWLWNRINFSCTTWTKEPIKTLCTYYFYSSRVVNIFFRNFFCIHPKLYVLHGYEDINMPILLRLVIFRKMQLEYVV